MIVDVFLVVVAAALVVAMICLPTDPDMCPDCYGTGEGFGPGMDAMPCTSCWGTGKRLGADEPEGEEG